MSQLPDALWLDAPDLVRSALDDAARGRPVSVPGAQYKALVQLMRYTPRSIVRGGSEVVRRRRGTGKAPAAGVDPSA